MLAVRRSAPYLGLLGLAIALAAAIYVIRTETAADEDARVPVGGPQLVIYSGEYQIFCAYDAEVLVEDGKVADVQEQRTDDDVSVGTAVAGVSASASYDERTGERIPVSIQVHWSEDGGLRAGCSPESIAVKDDGTETTLRELRASEDASSP